MCGRTYAHSGGLCVEYVSHRGGLCGGVCVHIVEDYVEEYVCT